MKQKSWLFRTRNSTPIIDRRERILRFIQPKGKRGIEVGALNRPIVTRADGEVLYADHLSTDGLRRKYAEDPDVNFDSFRNLVNVDIVTGGKSLCEVVSAGDKYDYIVASHVLEHIADPIGWLVGCTTIIDNGGIIFLALPDRRFTFDRYRADTTTGELIANYHSKVSCPTPVQVFEYYARHVYCGPEDVRRLWEGRGDSITFDDGIKLREALRLEIDVTCNNTYLDVHCSTFTPYSFSKIMYEIILLGMIPVEVVTIEPTIEREAEFFAILRKCDDASPGDRSSTVPRLDPIKHGRLPVQRLSWQRRLAHALRILLTGATH